MIENKDKSSSVAAAHYDVGDAVGVSEKKWFVAIVNNNTEKVSAARLSASGYECYLPVQSIVKIWRNGRKSKQDRVVIPTFIFIHCSENQRRQIVNYPFIKRFLMDRAKGASELSNRLATIPNSEIERLQFILGHSDTPVSIKEYKYRKGGKVRVIRGGLKGFEGEIIEINKSQSELVIALDLLGCATLLIDNIDVEPISDN